MPNGVRILQLSGSVRSLCDQLREMTSSQRTHVDAFLHARTGLDDPIEMQGAPPIHSRKALGGHAGLTTTDPANQQPASSSLHSSSAQAGTAPAVDVDSQQVWRRHGMLMSLLDRQGGNDLGRRTALLRRILDAFREGSLGRFSLD